MTTTTTAAAAAAKEDAPVPPTGQAEAFEQARVAVARALDKKSKKQGKRKSSVKSFASATRLCVELPVADDSDGALVAMASATVGREGATEATCVFGRASAAALARATPGVEYEVVSIDEAWPPAMACERDGIIALVGVAAEDADKAARKSRAGEGRPIVAVNVEWEHDGDGGVNFDQMRTGEPTELEAFTNSFVVVYSFLPLSIQIGWGGNLEGAVFKCVRGGAPAGSPWRIMVKEGAKFDQVGAMQRRPQQSDIEAALYNSMAAKSPVNKGVGFFREGVQGLFNKKK